MQILCPLIIKKQNKNWCVQQWKKNLWILLIVILFLGHDILVVDFKHLERSLKTQKYNMAVGPCQRKQLDNVISYCFQLQNNDKSLYYLENDLSFKTQLFKIFMRQVSIL